VKNPAPGANAVPTRLFDGFHRSCRKTVINETLVRKPEASAASCTLDAKPERTTILKMICT
jgi:hypothetical protein